MKAIVCSMMLLPSLLWAQVESQSSDRYHPFFRSNDRVSEALLEEEEVPLLLYGRSTAVPESISQRAIIKANGLFQQRENREQPH